MFDIVDGIFAHNAATHTTTHDWRGVSENNTPDWPGWHLELGVGLCKVCDDSAMGDTARYGAPIVGDQCGGCGAQTYECWLKDD